MGARRYISAEEKTLIVALLESKQDVRHYVEALDNLLVEQMADGGMGSLLLIPNEAESSNRSFGKEIVAGEFTDSDNVPVSVTINVDTNERLFELDVWKVNFAPLLRWPKPTDVRIVKNDS